MILIDTGFPKNAADTARRERACSAPRHKTVPRRTARSGIVAPWLSADDVDYYAETLAKSGFTGPVNRYRAQDLEVEELRPYGGVMIGRPTLFIGGADDPGRSLVPGVDRSSRPLAHCSDPRGAYVLDGIGHFVQQEAPRQVNDLILQFLSNLG